MCCSFLNNLGEEALHPSDWGSILKRVIAEVGADCEGTKVFSQIYLFFSVAASINF